MFLPSVRFGISRHICDGSYSFYVNYYVNQNETDSVEFLITVVIFSAPHIEGFRLVNIVFGP